MHEQAASATAGLLGAAEALLLTSGAYSGGSPCSPVGWQPTSRCAGHGRRAAGGNQACNTRAASSAAQKASPQQRQALQQRAAAPGAARILSQTGLAVLTVFRAVPHTATSGRPRRPRLAAAARRVDAAHCGLCTCPRQLRVGNSALALHIIDPGAGSVRRGCKLLHRAACCPPIAARHSAASCTWDVCVPHIQPGPGCLLINCSRRDASRLPLPPARRRPPASPMQRTATRRAPVGGSCRRRARRASAGQVAARQRWPRGTRCAACGWVAGAVLAWGGVAGLGVGAFADSSAGHAAWSVVE